MRPSGRPHPPFRWVSAIFGNRRVWEYRQRGGPCVGCGRDTKWLWVGSCEDFMRATNIVASFNVPLGFALRVPGIERDGRVTCYECRESLARASGKARP